MFIVNKIIVLTAKRTEVAHKTRHLRASHLKVPKREIFDSSYFPDFYTIKSLRVGDFGVKIKKKKIFRGSFRVAKFLTCMLSLFLRSFFSKLGPNKFFSVELLRPLDSVNNDFLNFLNFLGT
jgi:hypothetical protein